MSKDITVFTTLFGDTYNNISDPLVVESTTNYICYTDNPNVTSDFYRCLT